MPEISRFYGITIAIFYGEERHLGHPHFHANYGDHDVSIDIETLDVLAGSLPPSALRMVRRWAKLHQGELDLNWRRARKGETLVRIAPLP